MARPVSDEMVQRAKAVLEDHLGGFVAIPTVRAALEAALAETPVWVQWNGAEYEGVEGGW